jgi:acetylornithine deacetylase/succinyl-diaminopimelate desuccinylase-like protein
MPADATTLRRWLDEHRDQVVDELTRWARIASVAGPPEHEADLVESAQWLTTTLTGIGFPVVEVWQRDAAPTVWAEWLTDPSVPTVLVYSHHDVRTAKPDQWRRCPPFEPVLDGDRLYGRGTSDAKGQVLAHLWAVRAVAAAGTGSPPVNLKLLIDGEEETGSPHLAELLDDHADRAAADLVVFSDTMTWSADNPALCLAVRGLIKGELELRGANADLHSGAVSGAAPNAAEALIAVLAGLHDPDGRVSVPGFYDDVREVSAVERDELARLTGDEQDWLARTGTRAVIGERGRTIGERLYTRPAAEVIALAAGDPSPPTRGAVPATASAQLQLSLVPDQEPAAITARLRDWVAARVPEGCTYELRIPEQISAPPYATPPDHPAVSLLGEAMADAWARPVGRMRNAGSGPVALLADRTAAPALFFGTGLPEDGWHGPDESVDVGMLLTGATALAMFWQRLAARFSPRP